MSYLLQEDKFRVILEDETGFIILELEADEWRCTKRYVSKICEPVELCSTIEKVYEFVSPTRVVLEMCSELVTEVPLISDIKKEIKLYGDLCW